MKVGTQSPLNPVQAAVTGLPTNPPRFPVDQRTRAGAFLPANISSIWEEVAC